MGMAYNYNPDQPYRIRTFREDGWDGGDKNPPEYYADLDEALEQAQFFVTTGEWLKVRVEHWEDGLFGWGWYRIAEITEEIERTDTDGQDKNHG